MKFIFGFMIFLVMTTRIFACHGVEVDSCEAVVGPSEEKCRLRYEILYEMNAHADQQGPRSYRGKQCGYSGFRCVRMGQLCTKYHN